MKKIVLLVAALGLAFGVPCAEAKSRKSDGQTHHVYCADGHTRVETDNIDQMHTRFGSDVCDLHQSSSSSGARDWMEKNVPSGNCDCGNGDAASAPDTVQKYTVYCINKATSVEMWDIDQMKSRYGSSVCQLYQDTSNSGAIDWMKRNFPSGECSCS